MRACNLGNETNKTGKSFRLPRFVAVVLNWSGREDLNLRPLEPHSSALPDCATPRHEHYPLPLYHYSVKK